MYMGPLMADDGVSIIYTTVGASDISLKSEFSHTAGKLSSHSVAMHIAEVIILEKLAFCANVGGRVDSVFWYNGVVDRSDDDGEVIMQIKTIRSIVGNAMGRLAELHPYSTPMIWVIHADMVGPDASEWIAKVFK